MLQLARTSSLQKSTGAPCSSAIVTQRTPCRSAAIGSTAAQSCCVFLPLRRWHSETYSCAISGCETTTSAASPSHVGFSPLRRASDEHHACLCCASSLRSAAPAKAPEKASTDTNGSHTIADDWCAVLHHVHSYPAACASPRTSPTVGTCSAPSTSSRSTCRTGGTVIAAASVAIGAAAAATTAPSPSRLSASSPSVCGSSLGARRRR